MLANLSIALTTTYRPEALQLQIWTVCFGLNALSWFGYLCGFRAATVSEAILSLGRMLSVVSAASFFLLDLVANYSPLSFVLWVPLVQLMGAIGTLYLSLWPACIILLLFEGHYLFSILPREERFN